MKYVQVFWLWTVTLALSGYLVILVESARIYEVPLVGTIIRFHDQNELIAQLIWWTVAAILIAAAITSSTWAVMKKSNS